MHFYDMPISCYLHGMWISHLRVMPHILGTFHFFIVVFVEFACSVWWHWVLPTLCYPPPLHNTGTFLSLAGQIFFRIFQLWRLIFWFHILLQCAIVWWYMLVWLIFWFYWCFVIETLRCCFYVPWHGEVGFLSLVIPIKCESNIYFTFPIFCYLIMFFEYNYEVVCMLFA